MVSPAPVISVNKLNKRFGTVTAVDSLSFSVGHGEIFGLVGPDGAGKTTTLRMLAGVMTADGGEMAIDGIDVIKDPEEVKLHLSYMPQRFGLYEDLTVDENLRFYADLFDITPNVREERVQRLLRASGMEQFRRRLAGQLSGGMKQKLGLCCSLVHTPKVLLLDEPTTGVDPVSRRDFWSILYGLREEGVTILITTAYLDEAERCGRLGLLHDGRLIQCDTPRTLKTLMPGSVLSISADDPHKARDALADQEGITSLLLVGDGVHAVVDDAALRVPQLRAHLAEHGVTGAEVRTTPPSIEDLFVALLSGNNSHGS